MSTIINTDPVEVERHTFKPTDPAVGFTAPHVHRAGPYDTFTAAEVLDLLSTLPFWADMPPRAASGLRRRTRRLLDWLVGFAGEGWQDRWFAADGDNMPWSQTSQGDAVFGDHRIDIVAGLRPLLLLRVIAPGYGFFRNYRANIVYQETLDTVHPPGTRELIARAFTDLSINGRHRHDVVKSLAKIVLHTGKPITDLEPDDLFELRAWSLAHGRSAVGLHGVWEVVVGVGALPFGSSLRAALREGQRPTAELVDRYRLRPGPVRDLLIRYLDERRPALDYNTFRSLLGVLVGTFWADIERHHPSLDTIDLPAEVAEQWKQRLQTCRGRKGPTARSVSDQFSVKIKVRAFYLDLQQWALEDPSWAQWSVPCPIRRTEVAGTAKSKREASARMHQRVRDRLPHLGDLVTIAEQARREDTGLLQAATTAGPGAGFEYAGQSYQRATTRTYECGPFTRRLAHPDVLVIDVATGEQLNLSVREEDSFWAWAIIETLRHTGIRLEELLELTHLALVSYTLPDTGETVPLLQIVPSKNNQERLLLIPPELAAVLAEIVARLRDRHDAVPLVPRYDPYERTTGPALPHFFQRRYGWRREVMSSSYVYRLLNVTTAKAGIVDVSGQPIRFLPHDFRRIFASDAVSGGLPVHIAAKLLGHEHLSTTEHYLAVFQDDLIRSYQAFLSGRRTSRPAEEYREPTDQEWAEFQQHFHLRRVELGNCGRPYASPCRHEFACIRCPMLRVEHRQRPRLVEIIDNLHHRITEADNHRWHGEAQGLRTSLRAAQDKLASLDRQVPTALPFPEVRR
ncbi:site-specific integrase [Nocardia sp. NPDC049737]|uniref:tyrosine-type recombinase/integrase n=1 Tax=Nocardia sp. NPDC049737 TaxID=3154358 RepID=UPI00342CEF7C